MRRFSRANRSRAVVDKMLDVAGWMADGRADWEESARAEGVRGEIGLGR